MNHDPEEWHRNWTRTVGDQVRKVRGQRGMSAQVLSDRCAAIGYPIPRNTITNLENGRKTTLTLGELVVLAAALDSHPVQLLYPLVEVEEVGVLPGLVVTPLEALQWFAALGTINVPGQAGVTERTDDDQALDAGRKYLEVKRERDIRSRSFNTWRRHRATQKEIEEHEAAMRPIYHELAVAIEQLGELRTGIPGYEQLISEREREVEGSNDE